MKLTRTLALIVFVLFVFVLPALAQEALSEDSASFFVPPVLVQLGVGVSVLVASFKLYLESGSLPFTPPQDLKRFLVLISAIVLSAVAVLVTPGALEAGFEDNLLLDYPLAMLMINTLFVAFGAQVADMLVSLRNLGKKPIPTTSG